MNKYLNKIYCIQSTITNELIELIIVFDKKLSVYRIVNLLSGTIWDNSFERYEDAEEYIITTRKRKRKTDITYVYSPLAI